MVHTIYSISYKNGTFVSFLSYNYFSRETDKQPLEYNIPKGENSVTHDIGPINSNFS